MFLFIDLSVRDQVLPTRTAGEPFVRYYRGGGTGTPFDMVEGPMLGNPSAFMRGRAPRWFGNQVAFFGDTGRILDAALQ